MSRWRILAAVVACLAALAVGTPAFAGLIAPPVQAEDGAATADDCTSCEECDAKPCVEWVDCSAPCSAFAPSLAAAWVELMHETPGGTLVPRALGALVGERPPPDPLPPRS